MSQRRVAARLALPLAIAALTAAAVAAWLVYDATRSSAGSSAHFSPVVSTAGLAARSGVRVVRVALTGGDGLVDLRYQVVDAEKAVSLHAAATPPLLIDERTGAVVKDVLMGHRETGTPKAGLTYYIIFLNSGAVLAKGSRVTVQLGDARLAHVRVQ
jgi:hypothetical protein